MVYVVELTRSESVSVLPVLILDNVKGNSMDFNRNWRTLFIGELSVYFVEYGLYVDELVVLVLVS
jgi:hypothetical protein